MCTGYSDTVNKPEAQALGIKEFLSKPIKMKELTKAVRFVLDNASKPVSEPVLTEY